MKPITLMILTLAGYLLMYRFYGSVLIGGLHDLGALVISLRNQGKSIADFSGKYINKQNMRYLLSEHTYLF